MVIRIIIQVLFNVELFLIKCLVSVYSDTKTNDLFKKKNYFSIEINLSFETYCNFIWGFIYLFFAVENPYLGKATNYKHNMVINLLYGHGGGTVV